MSHTDKTRPGWVQESDPLNQRFRRVSQYDWFWKKMFALHKCWCCSQKKAFFFEERTKRTQWRKERQELLGSWQFEQWLWEDRDYYDHWAHNDENCPSNEVWRAEVENEQGLRFVDFNGKYTVG